MIKDFEVCGYVMKDENGVLHEYDLNGKEIDYAGVKNKQINELYQECMTLDDLESASMLYDSHNYNSFFEKFETPIENLSNEDRFILYKNLYCYAREGNAIIAELLQDEVKKNGVPQIEIDNILRNVKFDSDGCVEVYRGVNSYNEASRGMLGSSYTLSEEKAIWFSERFGQENQIDVTCIGVKLEDIIFFDNGREEQEVFIKDETIKRYY